MLIHRSHPETACHGGREETSPALPFWHREGAFFITEQCQIEADSPGSPRSLIATGVPQFAAAVLNRSRQQFLPVPPALAAYQHRRFSRSDIPCQGLILQLGRLAYDISNPNCSRSSGSRPRFSS